jgi:hypothetical protein
MSDPIRKRIPEVFVMSRNTPVVSDELDTVVAQAAANAARAVRRKA